MAVAFVQHLGAISYGPPSPNTQTVLTVSSLTVTAGNTIVVGGAAYLTTGGPFSCADNLGNTYDLLVERFNAVTSHPLMFAARITHGGTLTSITITHDAATFSVISAAEFSGIVGFRADAGGISGTGTTATWMSSGSIPPGGAAVGFVYQNNDNAHTAGAASGSPSTTIVIDNYHPDGTNISSGYAHAIGAGGGVSAFTGTSTLAASDAWKGVGAVFDSFDASYQATKISNRKVGPTALRHNFHRAYSSPPETAVVAAFDPANGFPYQDSEDERWVQDQSVADPTTDLRVAFGPPLNAVLAQVLNGDPELWQQLPTDDPSIQSWAVGPPQNAVSAQAFNTPQDAAFVPTDDDTDQALNPGPPPEVLVPHNQPDETLAVAGTDDSAPSLAIQPPAAAPFDPSAGFPWDANGAETPTIPQDVTEPDSAIAFGFDKFDPTVGGAWNAEEGERWVTSQLTADEPAQTYPIQPPVVAAVSQLTAFAVEGGEVQQVPGDDPSVQSWAVGPPQNAAQALVFNQPEDEPYTTVEDPTVPTYAIAPPPYVPVFQSTAFNGDPDNWQQAPDDDPSIQSWAVGPPLNATQLQSFHGIPEPWQLQQVPLEDLTGQAYTIQPPTAAAFDPSAGFPWPTSDDIVQPVWATPDETAQAWAIVPPFNPAAGFPFNAPQDVPVPAWMVDEINVQPWTAPLGLISVVTGGYGPGGSAMNAMTGGNATAPAPSGGAVGPVPGGSAVNPRPQR